MYYDMIVLYHPGKANVVADDLSRMTVGTMSDVEESKKDLMKDAHRLVRLGVQSEDSSKGGFMVHYDSKSSLGVEVKSKQHIDPLLMDLNKLVL